MIIHNIEQRTDEWFQVRLGKFTASTFGKLKMGKSTAGYNDLIAQVVFERLTGEKPESFTNGWMDRGNELESDAIKAYEKQTFNKVHSIGFVEFDEWIGCSPDGLIDNDGLIQIKCPKYSTLMNYHFNGLNDKNYIYQVQGEMFVTGRAYNIFYAWHPLLKPFMLKVERDEKIIDDIKSELKIAIEFAKQKMELLK